MGDKQRRLEVELEDDLYMEVKARADGVGIPLDDFVAQCIEFALEHSDNEIDNTLPGGQGGQPDQGLPGSQPKPDQGLPGSGGRPDQGLPGSQPKPDQGLPQQGANPNLNPDLDPDLKGGKRPDQELPETPKPKK
jgi:hypothetical protein